MASDDRHTRTYELLDRNTTEKYFIEYQGGLFNHLSHALYALDKLQAPFQLTEDFVEWSAKEKLEDPEQHKQPSTKARDYHTTYYSNYSEYQKKLRDVYSGSIDQLIRGEFPKLSPGMIGSALHGMIHIGYGYASRRAWFVCEGLAYLKSAYLPFEFMDCPPKLETLGSGSQNILDVVNLVRQDENLVGLLKQVKESLNEKVFFSRKSTPIISQKSDQISELVHQIKFPEHLKANVFTLGRVPEFAKWLVDCSIIVYAIAQKKNDFFLLHGVTGSWSLAQVLPLLDTKEDVLSSVHTFLCCLLVVYLVQDYPALDMSLLEQNDGMTHEWPDLIQKAVVHQDHEREHQFKLVQVCKDMSDRNNDPVMESIYRLAAYKCVTHPYDF